MFLAVSIRARPICFLSVRPGRLIGAGAERHWDGRRHFFAAAAEAMWRILIDRARTKRRPSMPKPEHGRQAPGQPDEEGMCTKQAHPVPSPQMPRGCYGPTNVARAA